MEERGEKERERGRREREREEEKRGFFGVCFVSAFFGERVERFVPF